MSAIDEHSPELAAVVDAGALAYLAPFIAHPDAKLKRQVCAAHAGADCHLLYSFLSLLYSPSLVSTVVGEAPCNFPAASARR
jgi:hypothetical protein